MAYGQGPEDPRQWQTQPGWSPEYQQQYQQPYDQQYQQPHGQPPGMYGPPPPRKSNAPIIILAVGAALLFLFGGCAVFFVVASSDRPTVATTAAPEASTAVAEDDTTQPSAEESAAPSAPQEDATQAATGGTLSLQGLDPGLRVDVTVTKVIANATPANQFLEPKAGNRFVAVELRLVNKGQAVYEDSPSNGAILIDEEGQQYRPVFAEVREGVSLGSVTVNSGDSRKGVIVYEMPDGARPAKFQFALNSGFARQKGEWKIG